MSATFDPQKLTVNSSEIEEIEKLFGFQFNEGQISFLKHWQTADIQACPGSGKTTVLAAKLILLVQKIPPGYEKGVCVITHTNAAVKEIKGKLGDFVGFYNRYPNHFGTIQSFVDMYLALPAYRSLFHRTPSIVDTETYNQVLVNHPLIKFRSLNFLENKKIYPGSFSFNKINFEVSKSLNECTPINISNVSKEVVDKHIGYINKAKQTLLEDGYLKYDEAYSMAFRYLREHPEIKKCFGLRFPFVFIDERQDMEIHQTEIIETLFNSPKVVVQQIGDTNQAIYTHPDSKDISVWKPAKQKDVQLLVSNRLPHHIASKVSPICTDPQDMKGVEVIKPIPPVVIVYDDITISEVIDCFGRLVIKHNLQDKGECKCIGFRNSDARLNLNSYWKDYSRKKIKSEYLHLASYNDELKQSLENSKNITHFKKILLEAICRGLRIGKVKTPLTQKYFTTSSLNRHYQQQGKLEGFHTRIGGWIKQMQKGENILSNLSAFLTSLLQHFKAEDSTELKAFLENSQVEIKLEAPEQTIYHFTLNDKAVNLQFDTIHGVKGETHAATLFLETFHILYDIGGKILPFIAGNVMQQSKYRRDGAYIKRLPLAYVALTRATNLVALTVHKDRFTQQLNGYFLDRENGWNVIFLNPNEE